MQRYAILIFRDEKGLAREQCAIAIKRLPKQGEKKTKLRALNLTSLSFSLITCLNFSPFKHPLYVISRPHFIYMDEKEKFANLLKKEFSCANLDHASARMSLAQKCSVFYRRNSWLLCETENC
jgi:hypothetical protein